MFFRNASFARFSIDAARWPRTVAFVMRETYGLPAPRRGVMPLA